MDSDEPEWADSQDAQSSSLCKKHCGWPGLKECVSLYWQSWLAQLGCITYWTGVWDIIDVYFRAWFWSYKQIYWDVITIIVGAVLLLLTGTYVSSSGLEFNPPVVEASGLSGKANLFIAVMASMYGQVSLGLGIYNMFDMYMFEESLWWNITCCIFGLILLLATKTIFFNAGLLPEERERPNTLKGRIFLHIRATLGIVGAFVLWKGWEQTLDFSLGLGQVFWRELIYFGVGFVILIMTKTFFVTAGTVSESVAEHKSTPFDSNVTVNRFGYTVVRDIASIANTPVRMQDNTSLGVPSSNTPVMSAKGSPLAPTLQQSSPLPPPMSIQDISSIYTPSPNLPSLSASLSPQVTSPPTHQRAISELSLTPATAPTESAPPRKSSHSSNDGIPHPMQSSPGLRTPVPFFRPASIPPPSLSSPPFQPAYVPRPSMKDIQIHHQQHAVSARTQCCREFRLYLRCSLAYFGVITMWTGIWNLQINNVTQSFWRDFAYTLLGLIFLVVSGTLLDNAILSPMNWGNAKSSVIEDQHLFAEEETTEMELDSEPQSVELSNEDAFDHELRTLPPRRAQIRRSSSATGSPPSELFPSPAGIPRSSSRGELASGTRSSLFGERLSHGGAYVQLRTEESSHS